MLIVEEEDGTSPKGKGERAYEPGQQKTVEIVAMFVRNRADQISVIYRDDKTPAAPTEWPLS